MVNVEAAVKREKTTMMIAPLYFPYAVIQFIQHFGVYDLSALRNPFFNILNALVLVLAWAVIRSQIFNASQPNNSQVVYYGFFPLMFSIAKICLIGGLGILIVPIDLLSGYSKISKLKKIQSALVIEKSAALNDFAIVQN